MIGGMGSWCPGLMPRAPTLRYRATMFAAVFDNGDGILVVFPETRRLGIEAPPVYMRLLPTDSRHYIIPTDNQHIREEVDQQCLHGIIKDHLQIFWQFKPIRSVGPSAEFQVDEAPLDTSTRAKSASFAGHGSELPEADIMKQLSDPGQRIDDFREHIISPTHPGTRHFVK
eukprot:1525668-Pyramimonas_sp.AAC.1